MRKFTIGIYFITLTIVIVSLFIKRYDITALGMLIYTIALQLETVERVREIEFVSKVQTKMIKDLYIELGKKEGL